ncbi:MAG: NADH-quinone oxidoreductase subunit C [bacterium]
MITDGREDEITKSPEKKFTPEEIKSIVEKKLSNKTEDATIINRQLALWVKPENLLEVCRFLKESELDFGHPSCLSGVDRREYLEVVYHLYSITRRHKITVKVRVSCEEPMVPSLHSIYKGVDWHEREAAEMFGIVFQGHPDPRHLLLDEDVKGHPLRKNFAAHHRKETNP